MAERLVYTQEVAGSSPAPPTVIDLQWEFEILNSKFKILNLTFNLGFSKMKLFRVSCFGF